MRYSNDDTRLLVRYLTGECRAWEEDELRARIATDAELAARLAELEQTWEQAGKYPAGDVDINAGRRRIAEIVKIRPLPATSASVGRSHHHASDRFYFLRIAAVFLILIGATVTAARLGLIAPGAPAEPEPPHESVFATRAGQRATIQLTDGTQVRLNVASRLTVSASFAEGSRDVWLEGEALFEVAPDSTRPFTVHAHGVRTRVLGTQFIVRHYLGESNTRVVVVEGKVRMANDEGLPRDSVVLRANELGLAAGGRLLRRTAVPVDEYMAWTGGRLVFRKAPFPVVAAELERWFDLDVQFQGRHSEVYRLNTTFTDQPLSEILNVIARSLNLEYVRHGRHVLFRPATESAS